MNVFLFIALILIPAFLDGQEKRQRTYYVRVLLDEKKAEAGTLWKLSGSHNFRVLDVDDPLKCQTIKGTHVTIGLRDKMTLAINNKRVAAQSVKIEPTNGNITFGQHSYKGSFYVMRVNDNIQLINRIELEDYVDSGVRWEMVPGWPAASLEAGAIAYRTYVIATLRSVRSKDKNKSLKYDIRCTPIHQVYKGVHNCECIHAAVKKTKGLIITYNKEPIMALYDACCGGVIPIRRSGVDFEKAPYLARSYPCTHCKKFKYYSWHALYTLKDLGLHLEAALPTKGPLTDVKIKSKDRAGCVDGFQVKIKKEWYDFPVGKLPHLAKHIKSSTFTLTKRGKLIKFKGKGLGHQLGFCQWGSKELALKGWDFKRILRFYYPGITIMKAEGI